MAMITDKNNGTSGNKGGGFGKGLLVLGIIAVLVFGIGSMTGAFTGGSSSNGNSGGGTTIIYQNYGSEGNGSEDKEEVTTPIRDKYSCQGNYYSVFTNMQNVTDNFGTTYETANEAYVSINANTKKLTYALDGSYRYLRGTIYLSEQNKDNINYFRVYIYDENGNCIYQSADITSKNLGPLNINCNISGLTRVTIELEGCTMTCGGVRIIMPDEGFVFVE